MTCAPGSAAVIVSASYKTEIPAFYGETRNGSPFQEGFKVVARRGFRGSWKDQPGMPSGHSACPDAAEAFWSGDRGVALQSHLFSSLLVHPTMFATSRLWPPRWKGARTTSRQPAGLGLRREP